MNKVFAKTPKTSILDHFLDFLGTPNPTGLFVKNWALPRFLLYDYLTFFQSFKKKSSAIPEILVVDTRTNKRTVPNS